MTTHTKCRICGKDIVLVPSAKQRSISTGQPESYFLNLFTTHSECFLEKRKQDFSETISRLNNQHQHISRKSYEN